MVETQFDPSVRREALRWTRLSGSSALLVKIAECRRGKPNQGGSAVLAGLAQITAYDYPLPVQSVFAVGSLRFTKSVEEPESWTGSYGCY